jgi:DNA primase
MRYPPSILDEIRARLPISTVIGKRVKLVKAGREWKGLSPFNSEKTPSFFVNDEKSRFFDFSSGKDGDIFNFLMETEGLSFPEAVERLAGEAGVALPVASAESERQEAVRAGLHEVMEMAASFFEANLNGKAGGEARRYLASRDLDAAVQAEFRLGYASPDRFALRDHLAGKGVASRDMIDAGLLIEHEDVAVPYDRFRDRVMFPITDLRGRVIAFGGRALSKEVQAKYLNSPETPLFHKGANLYNQHRARKAAHDKGFVIAVEGYVDVIAMVRAGFVNTVAPLGTALTEDQLRLMWRMGPEPVLCFDGDKAGQRAAFRAIDVALPEIGAGRTLRFAFLPEGQDPDDLLRNAGAGALAAVVEQVQPLVEVIWMREHGRAPLETPEQRADFERRLHGVVRGIGDETLRKHYRAALDERLAALFQAPGREGHAQKRTPGRFQRGGRGGRGAPATPSLSLASAPVQISASLRSALFGAEAGYPAREVALLVGAINHPDILQRNAEMLVGLPFSAPPLARLAHVLVDCVSTLDQPEPERLRAAIRARGLGPELDRMDKALNHADWWARVDAALFDAEMAWMQAADLHHKVRTLHKELREIEAECGRDRSESSLQRLNAVRNRLAVLEDGGLPVEKFGPGSD